MCVCVSVCANDKNKTKALILKIIIIVTILAFNFKIDITKIVYIGFVRRRLTQLLFCLFSFRFSRNTGWGVICGDGFSVLEAMVICRCTGHGHAAGAFQTDQFGGLDRPVVLSAVECRGNETSLAHCYHQHRATCSSRKDTVAAVSCVPREYTPRKGLRVPVRLPMTAV